MRKANPDDPAVCCMRCTDVLQAERPESLTAVLKRHLSVKHRERTPHTGRDSFRRAVSMISPEKRLRLQTYLGFGSELVDSRTAAERLANLPRRAANG